MVPQSSWPRWGLLACVVVGLSQATAASAQVTADQMNQRLDQEQAMNATGSLNGGIGIGMLDEDWIAYLTLGLNVDFDMWGFGLRMPMRIRLVDRDPQDTDDLGSFLRREDWDQPSDFLRVLRYVYVGKRDKSGPFYIRLGELSNLSLGHGTIMHRYYNTFDISRWRAGLNAKVEIEGAGAEVMVSDLTDWHVVGGRMTARPLRWALGQGWWERFVVGASVFADTKAPFELSRDPNDPNRTLVNDQDEPLVDRNRSFVIAGFDLGLELEATSFLRITPYMDLNRMTSVVDQGWGWHLGVWWNFAFPALIDTLVLDLRTEYRYVSGDYLAPYFNSVYEIERFNALGVPGPVPKLRCLQAAECALNAGEARHGYFFEGQLGLPQYVFLSGEYLDYEGDRPDGQLTVGLHIPALEFLQLSAYYFRVNVEGPSDLFALDDKSGVVGQVTIPLGSFLVFQPRWTRVWRADQETGGYRSVDEWSVGVGFSYDF